MNQNEIPAVRLTDEQRRALEVKGASVALGAGAGCGKTTVLTERFLDEIEGQGGRPLRALVALTFTEKAARELRERIRRRCREKLAGGEEVARWRTVLRALEAAPIGTFHEFCARLLRRHALELGVDPDFTIIDATISATLRDEAVRTAVRRMLAERRPDLMSLAVDYGLGQIREVLGLLIASRTAGDLGAWLDLSARELVGRWTEVWEQQGRPAAALGLAPAAKCCRELLAGLGSVHPKLRQRRAELMERLPLLESGECSGDLLAQVKSLARVADLRGQGIWPGDDVQKAVKAVFESLRKKIEGFYEKTAISETQSLASAENSLALLRLAGRVREEYQKIKSRRRGLDFDDLLLLTRDLPGGDSGLLPASLAGEDSIEFVLVDEFQDTDRIQSEILRRLGGIELFEHRMFVVGDPKQSIYRFRGAEPAIFGQWRSEFTARGRLSLTENFRSVPGVIDFVNALFADCFADEGAVRGPDSLGLRLVPTRPDATADPAVTFFWALPAEPPDAEPDTAIRASADERRRNEARGLARLLRNRLDAGWTIIDRQTNAPRRAHAGDVAFLFRAMTDVWPYEAALADQDFDYHTLGGSAFYVQQEIRDVANVLSVVEDPLDVVALAGALRSPFFGLSDSGLFWLARKFSGGLPEGIERAAEIEELSDRDREVAERAHALLDGWRQAKDHASIASLVARVLDESGFEAALVCEFLGSRKLANTRKLVRMARDFDRQGGFTLGDFVARLRTDLNDPPREEQAATTEEDSPTIRLMSIHQAKGLEFPIVVIPDLNRQANPRGALLGLHAELGLVVRPPRQPSPPADDAAEPDRGESVGWLTFQAIEDVEDRKESLRLLYVATTRARDHLILSAGLESQPTIAARPESALLSSLGSCRSLDPAQPRAAATAFQLLLERFDWQTGRCLAALPDGLPAPRVEAIVTPPPEAEPARPRHSIRRRIQEIEEAIAKTPMGAAQELPGIDLAHSLIDLDPAQAVSARAARLHRLVRGALADRGLLGGEVVAQVCARLGVRQVPAANSRVVSEAVLWLGAWPEAPLFQELRDASRGRKSLKRDVGWMLPFPLRAGDSTVIRGRCDVLYRDRRGRWRPVIVCVGQEGEEIDILRSLFATAAARRAGFDPLGPAWRVRPSRGEETRTEVQLEVSPAMLGDALRKWIEQVRSADRVAPGATH
jgi:ATP-dependent helicase/nuclease subunit A